MPCLITYIRKETDHAAAAHVSKKKYRLKDTVRKVCALVVERVMT